jgi:dTDP-4-dehydrorhamnose reductase
VKILLLGANGQVGTELTHFLAPLGELLCCDRQQADLTDAENLQRVIREFSPDVVVNAAAYTAVDNAESDVEVAYAVNKTAVAIIAVEVKKLGGWLVHYSTDYVFDGSKPEAYNEQDPANPLNVYGKSKYHGEQAISDSECKHFILRTSWVIGASGNNFVKTIFRLAQERDSISVVVDQKGVPTSAEMIAQVTFDLLSNLSKHANSSGVYNMAPNGETTWHEIAQRIVIAAQQNGHKLLLRPENIRAIPAVEYPTPAARPMNSTLDTAKLQSLLTFKLPDWQLGVDRVVARLCEQEVTAN